MSSGSEWLVRYRGGEQEAVWHEMRALGERIREPRHAADAQAVCDEWARRVRHNLDLLVERLREQGYRFHDGEKTPTTPFAPPGPDAAEHVRWLDEHVGPVPMTVSSWVRVVGDVWLVGTHPHWPRASASDPFVLELAGGRHPGEDVRAYVLDELEQFEEEGEDEQFPLPFAPDALHKDGVSGGLPYAVLLPDAGVDARVVLGDDEDEDLTLVGYVRAVLARGGFPGCSDDDASGPVIMSLRDALLPV